LKEESSTVRFVTSDVALLEIVLAITDNSTRGTERTQHYGLREARRFMGNRRHTDDTNSVTERLNESITEQCTLLVLASAWNLEREASQRLDLTTAA
jgi:hypothetical protein